MASVDLNHIQIHTERAQLDISGNIDREGAYILSIGHFRGTGIC